MSTTFKFQTSHVSRTFALSCYLTEDNETAYLKKQDRCDKCSSTSCELDLKSHIFILNLVLALKSKGP